MEPTSLAIQLALDYTNEKKKHTAKRKKTLALSHCGRNENGLKKTLSLGVAKPDENIDHEKPQKILPSDESCDESCVGVLLLLLVQNIPESRLDSRQREAHFMPTAPHGKWV